MMFSLRDARMLKHFTQEQVAKELSVCRDTYMKYEKKPELMPIGMAVKFSKIVEMGIDQLIFCS